MNSDSIGPSPNDTALREGPPEPRADSIGPSANPEVPSDVLAAFRRPPGRALMLGHVHPDADVLGTLLALGAALEDAGWRVVSGGPHPVPEFLRFLPGSDRYRVLPAVDERFDLAVLTDCPNPDRTEGLIEGARGNAPVVVNIDHHPDNRRYGTVNWVDPAAAATGELVYALIVALGLPVKPGIASNLFTAIHMDTGSFRYSNVTPQTFRVAAELVAAGAEPAFVGNQLYERRPPDALRQLGEVLSRVEVSADGRIAWLALPVGLVRDAFVEAEDLVNYPRSIGTTKVAALLRERPGGAVKVSLRAKGEVDVNKIAARFGGGGHANAAGCVVRGALAEATRQVLAAIRDALSR
jgi:phosphoesterase RecJ-like protein